ncbi:MAG: ScyD/ScyE family protein [Acidobacteriota bacterium]
MITLKKLLCQSKHFSLFLATLVLALTGTNAKAQCPTSVFATGLKAPTKIISTPAGNLLVAEAGMGQNTGRISIIDPSGNRRTLLDGLPSGLAPPNNAPIGPSGLALRGRTLYITIGAGDEVLAGPLPATEVPNPNPSSPLFSSVLAIRFNSSVEETTDGFALTLADHVNLNTGLPLNLTNAAGDRLTVELVTDFPDFTYEFRPGVPNNVRPSNPFGLVVNGRKLYVVDAAQNAIREVEINTGDSRILLTFPRRANTLPFGPPVIDPVPDSIRLFGKHLLVTFLTGFPFPPGQADVRRVNRTNNSHSQLIGGLTSAIDVLPVKNSSNQDQFIVLEFSTSMTAQPPAPGRLRLFDLSGQATVIADCLISPTSVALNTTDGFLYATEIFTGRIIRIPSPVM